MFCVSHMQITLIIYERCLARWRRNAFRLYHHVSRETPRNLGYI